MSKKTTHMEPNFAIDKDGVITEDHPRVEVIDRVPSKLPTRGFAPLVRREVIARSAADGRTQDWYREESSIDHILEKFHRSQDPSVLMRPGANPQYVDLPPGIDYQAAMIQVSQAESAFENLPAKMRAKFDNNPRTFLDALHDPANEGYFVAEGLLKPRPVPPQPKKNEGPPAPSKDTPEPPAQA